MAREKGRLWRVSLNASSCWQRADVPISFNEQISGLTPKSNEKQRVRECTISSALLLLLQIKSLRCDSWWYLRCSDPDARDDLCLNPLLLFWVGWFHWRTERLLLHLTDTVLSFLSPKCINLSLYSSSCDASLCPSHHLLRLSHLLYFCVTAVAEEDMLSNQTFLFGRIAWNAGFLWHIFLFKVPGWSAPRCHAFICSLELCAVVESRRLCVCTNARLDPSTEVKVLVTGPHSTLKRGVNALTFGTICNHAAHNLALNTK